MREITMTGPTTRALQKHYIPNVDLANYKYPSGICLCDRRIEKCN